jgi:hypothetical protein
MKLVRLALLIYLVTAVLPATAADDPAAEKLSQAFLGWAATPPMGWNSWDCYGAAVNEEQTRANVDYMAEKLAKFGWQYIVVDIQWYEPKAKGFNYRKDAELVTDEYGRLMPAVNRFPSAANGHGFKSLADYVHGKGLKFGIHLMRGIPKQAVNQNTPILGTQYHATDIADKANLCRWNGDMYGVDMAKPGAQEYYNSVFQLIASWDVDFVKVDDLGGRKPETAAVREAIDRSGRPMVFSISPGPMPLDQGEFAAEHANMWRISNDFWDNWRALKSQFDRCARWAMYNAPGHYPDADMLPLGAIRVERNDHTHFTQDEQRTMMTLWAISHSPLMMGGDMPKNDEFTLSLLTNQQVLAVDQHCLNSRQLFRDGNNIAWIADVPDSKAKYLAVFNAADKPQDDDSTTAPVTVSLQNLGFNGACRIHDLWTDKAVGSFTGEFAPAIGFHGAGLYRVEAEK